MPRSVIQTLQSPARLERTSQRKANVLFTQFEQDNFMFYEVPLPRTKKKTRNKKRQTLDLTDRLDQLAYEQRYATKLADNRKDDWETILDNALTTLSWHPIDWKINNTDIGEFSLDILGKASTYTVASQSDVVWIYTRHTNQSIQRLVLRANDKTLLQGSLLSYEATEFCRWLMIDDEDDPYPPNIQRTEEWDFILTCTADVPTPLAAQSSDLASKGVPKDFLADMQEVVDGEAQEYHESVEIKIGFEGTIIDARHEPLGYFR